MKRRLIPLVYVLTFSITASAQTYIITEGQLILITPQLVLQDITIDCESGESVPAVPRYYYSDRSLWELYLCIQCR